MKLSKYDDPEVQELLQDIEARIEGISSAMTGLNKIVSLQEASKESFNVRTVIAEVSAILNLAARRIDLDIKGNEEIYTEKALFKSIVFNIFMNSIQSFRTHQTKDPQIIVECLNSDSTLIQIKIADNGGGYRLELLKILAADSSERESTSGMGLFLISRGMKSIGGKVAFSNNEKGAQVILSFPNQNPQKKIG